jgi:hypothetical protein
MVVVEETMFHLVLAQQVVLAVVAQLQRAALETLEHFLQLKVMQAVLVHLA